MLETLRDQGSVLRGPYEVAIDITNRCNYRCLHCYNASGENTVCSDEMTDDEFLDLISDVCKLYPYNVCFCGGEPLLRSDLLCKSAEMLSDAKVNSASIVSNGYYMTKENCSRLHESGIKRVQISLDGKEESCAHLRRNPMAFAKAQDALRNLSEFDFKEIDVAFCPTSFNIDELRSVCEICRENGVKLLRIQPLMNIGRATSNLDDILPTKLQYIELQRKINELNYGYSGSLVINWGDPLDHIFRYRELYKDLSTFVTIKANGSICPSPYLPISVGNVKRHSLCEYWEQGLSRIWNLPEVKAISGNILSIYDMGNSFDGSPVPWLEKDIDIDIIDEDLIL